MLAVGTSAIRSGEAPRSPISQAEPTLCISVPMFEANWAMNSALNTGYRSGAHGEGRACAVSMSASLIEANPTHYEERVAFERASPTSSRGQR